tara:strand:- start:10139 stop:10864 length:726 start_codon:yes stop_codon:yes gene_type:complete
LNSFNFQEGETLLIDKPLNWTSFDVVNKIRGALKKHLDVKKLKVGHAGTLDPLASGLVILCTGKNTKKIEQFMGLDKVYTGTITLGGTTPTYDLESKITEVAVPEFDIETIRKAANTFKGSIDQMPPIYSAKRVKGQKAYELARRGKEVELKPSSIKIHEFEVVKVGPSKRLKNGQDCQFKISCSKGTYIRSVAFDLGEKLECGGFLSELRRTDIGNFSINEALTVEQFLEMLASLPKPVE